MDAALLATVLRRRRALRKHERWTRRALEVQQAGELRELRDFAYARSTFYQRFHAGLEDRPLHELPVLTKRELMSHYDEVATDPTSTSTTSPRTSRARTRPRSIASATGSRPRREVPARVGILVTDRDEWAWVLASYARANEWSSIRVGLTHRMKLAVVSSRTPWHQSARVAATLHGKLVPALRLDAQDPLPEIVAKLDDYQPENLVAYASRARVLAEEQLGGRLHIRPKSVMCDAAGQDRHTHDLVRRGLTDARLEPCIDPHRKRREVDELARNARVDASLERADGDSASEKELQRVLHVRREQVAQDRPRHRREIERARHAVAGDRQTTRLLCAHHGGRSGGHSTAPNPRRRSARQREVASPTRVRRTPARARPSPERRG